MTEALTTDPTEAVASLRRFHAQLQAKRDELAEAAATCPKAQKLVVRLDVVLAITDDVYRGLLN